MHDDHNNESSANRLTGFSNIQSRAAKPVSEFMLACWGKVRQLYKYPKQGDLMLVNYRIVILSQRDDD